MIDFVKDDIFKHAKRDPYRECCGLVIVFKGRYRYIPCRNLSELPQSNFFLDPMDWVRAEEQGKIVAVVHSHVQGVLEPSDTDRTACEQTQVPWIICNPNTDEIMQFEPCGYVAPLVGRHYCYGIHDCYTLARDYLKQKGIPLLQFPRLEPTEAFATGQYGFNDENFKKTHLRTIDISELQPNDFIVFSMSKPYNHCGVYMGDQRIIHHLHSRLSSIDIYGGYYIKQTERCLRYDANY